ncbi:MAG: PHB depolymerase family esterase [Burkholderiaceae bacterium]|nr:PHB depolymerase family esterase [Burkholderiaceae bacterium]
MARRLRLPSLSALTRAYQRNLKTLTRAMRSAQRAAAKVAKVAKATKVAKVAKTAKATKAAPRATAASQGDWIAGVATGPAGARRFHLHIPPGLALRPQEKLPLLLMLHGCDQTGLEFAQSTRMGKLAARERFLVLYPEQDRFANAQGCWNWFQQRNGMANAEAATLLAAVVQVAQSYPIDVARVAVAGLSAGGSMAALMGARFAAHFAAVIVHSGVTPGTADSALSALAAMGGHRTGHLPTPHASTISTISNAAPLPPLLVLQGTSDHVVSPRNGLAMAQLWAQALGAKASAATSQQRGKRYPMQVTPFKRQGRTVVELRDIVGLGHAWSGGGAKLAYSDPAGPDASALTWAFAARAFKQLSNAKQPQQK